MSKEIYISSTPHETRLAIVEDEALTEIYYERENEYTLAGSIYNGRVTRVLPGMQSSFVNIGLERDAFLYITDFMEEAPDSDEFDTTPASDRPRTINAERTDNGAADQSSGRTNDRGGRGRRGGRDRDRGPERNQDRSPDRDQPRQASPMRRRVSSRILPTPPPPLPAKRSMTPRSAKALPELNQTVAGVAAVAAAAGVAHPAQPTDPEQQNAAPTNLEDQTSTERDDQEIDAVAESTVAPPDRSSDRGRRDDSRNQRRDGQRFDVPRRDSYQRPDQRPQRVPRGFTPSRERYGVDTGEGGTGPGLQCLSRHRLRASH